MECKFKSAMSLVGTGQLFTPSENKKYSEKYVDLKHVKDICIGWFTQLYVWVFF